MINRTENIEQLSAMKWWNKNRIRYNIGLIISGFLAFISYVLVYQFLLISKVPNAEITLFTIVFQGIGYLIMMLIANLLYFLGPISESLINPNDVEKFRNRTFRLGYWFSCSLPFSIPIVLIIIYI